MALDTIARALWGDEELPTSGPGLVRTYISRLRRILGPSVIERIFDGYRVPETAGRVDLEDFRRYVRTARQSRNEGNPCHVVSQLRAGLGLWYGSPLAGTTRPFVQQYAEHLKDLRADTLEQCLHAELELGRSEEVVYELLAAVEEHPYRENLVASCMIALQRCGRTAQAIAVYVRTREMLAAELGIDPGPELQACYHAALHRRPTHMRGGAEPRTIGAIVPSAAPMNVLVASRVDDALGSTPSLRQP